MTDSSTPVPLRRSLLQHWHHQHGAIFDTAGATRWVRRYADEQISELSLTDLSTHPRVGFKGSGTSQWLSHQSVDLPHSPNCSTLQPDGSLVARLSDHEHLVLGNLAADASLPDDLQQRWEHDNSAQCYPLPRADSHSWFLLAGTAAPHVLSSLCAVDLRPEHFHNGSIAQTSLARANTIIIRDDAKHLRFHLLSDVSMALYMWEVLVDSVAALGGQATGVEQLINAQ